MCDMYLCVMCYVCMDVRTALADLASSTGVRRTALAQHGGARLGCLIMLRHHHTTLSVNCTLGNSPVFHRVTKR